MELPGNLRVGLPAREAFFMQVGDACLYRGQMLNLIKISGVGRLARKGSSWSILLLLLVFGGIIGGWVGEALTRVWPAVAGLGKTQSIGLPTFTMDLKVFTLHFGFMLNISLFTIIGFILAYLVFKRL
jgi:hypothetical protein